MTTHTIPTAQEVQDQVLSAVRKGQQAALEAIKSVAGAVSSVAPKFPAAATGITGPLAGMLPTPEAVVAKAYDLAGQALAEQRKLAAKLPRHEAAVASVFDFADAFLAGQRKFVEEALKATAALRPAAKAADETTSEAASQTAGEAPAE
jgi:hypothetical protein